MKKREFCTPTPRWNQKAIGEWNDEVLGGTSERGVIEHFKEEVQEFLDDLNEKGEPAEAADIVILLMLRAKQKGYDLLGEVYKKMEINRRRTWLPPDKDGVRRHA